jgi:membrane protein YdbS with pleckstrin-like domain
MTLSIIGAVVALAAVATLFVVPVTWVAHRRLDVRP